MRFWQPGCQRLTRHHRWQVTCIACTYAKHFELGRPCCRAAMYPKIRRVPRTLGSWALGPSASCGSGSCSACWRSCWRCGDWARAHRRGTLPPSLRLLLEGGNRLLPLVRTPLLEFLHWNLSTGICAAAVVLHTPCADVGYQSTNSRHSQSAE